MKVLFSHGSVYQGNGWGRTLPLAEGLVSLGFDVTILTSSKGTSLRRKIKHDNGVKIIIFPEIVPLRLSNIGFGFMSLFLKIIHVLLHQYDVVHSDNGHRPVSGIPCRIHRRFYHSIYISEWYDWFGKGGQYDKKSAIFKILFGRYELRWEKKDKKKADGVIVLSEILKQEALKFKDEKRVVKIHGGADVESIPFLQQNEGVKKKFHFDSDTIILGTISQNNNILSEFKPLIKAVKSLPSDIKLKIFVFGHSNGIENELDNSIKDKFVFWGWVNFKKDFLLLQMVDVFFLFQENSLTNIAGWRNCIGDFIACGRHVLLNPTGEVLDFILSNYNKAETVAFEGQKLMIEKYDSVKQSKHLLNFLSQL